MGQYLMKDAALHHGLDPAYRRSARTIQELVARSHVQLVKSTAWDALYWRYESSENMQQVSAERDEYEARFGRGAWPGNNK